MKPSFRAPERNENVRNCLRSPCGWQIRGNCVWARTANSDPHKIQVRLWCAWLHKNTGQYPVFPHIENSLTEHTSVHYIPMAEMLENVRWASTLLLEENPEMCGSQPPPESVQLPAIHWFLSNKTADKHSRASSGTEPCHCRKVKSMSTPGRIKFDLVSFPKHAKTWVQAGCECWIRPAHDLLTQGNCWAQQTTYSQSSITIYFMDQKIRYHFWRFLKAKGLCRKTVIFQWKEMQLKTMGVLFLFEVWSHLLFPFFSLQNSSGSPYSKLLRSRKMPRVEPDFQGCPHISAQCWVGAAAVTAQQRQVWQQSRAVGILSCWSICFRSHSYNDPPK